MYNDNSRKKISLIGLGQMGKKIAEMYVQRHYEVTIWNRTQEKARQVNTAKVARDVDEALEQSPVCFICVHDNTAVEKILDGVSSRKTFIGKTIINLTTGSPSEVKKLESWITERGGTYLNGAIQVAPDQMGLTDTTILMGGNKKAFDSCKETLHILGGNIKFLGEHASTSPAMDMATLSWVYGSYVGMIYGVALCQQEGMQLEDYRDILTEITPGFLEFFKHEINTIREGNFNITQSPLSISVSASQRIAETVKSMKLDASFTDAIAGLLRKAKESGHEQEELSAIIKVIRGDSGLR